MFFNLEIPPMDFSFSLISVQINVQINHTFELINPHELKNKKIDANKGSDFRSYNPTRIKRENTQTEIVIRPLN